MNSGSYQPTTSSAREMANHARGNVLTIPHEIVHSAATACKARLAAALLHIAEHHAHQVDQVVDDALISCGRQSIERD